MTSFQLELTSSPHFVNWLQQQDISLAFTTYQSNRLFLVGVKPNGGSCTLLVNPRSGDRWREISEANGVHSG